MSVTVAREGALTRITLMRAEKANALDAATVDALATAIDAAGTDGTRLLAISGDGRNFSAGFDFGGFEAQSEGDLLLRFVRIEEMLQRLYHAPYATLALAHGKNFGAGADLFVAARIRIAAPGTTFRMPGLRFGLQLGTRRLAASIGATAARAMLASSRTIEAEEAEALGFVTAIAAPERWPELVAAELATAQALAPEAAARLHAAIATDTRADDLADLVRSAAAPGLKDRIRAFRGAT